MRSLVVTSRRLLPTPSLTSTLHVLPTASRAGKILSNESVDRSTNFLNRCRCTRSLNHHRDGLSHFSDAKCKYQHQFDNKVYYCKACNERGDDVLVVPKTSSCNDSTMAGLVKYAWSGYILECKRCGIIYKSREYWYGNPDPYTKVHTVILHIWPGVSQGNLT